MDAHTTEEYKGYTIEIHYDTDSINPRRDYYPFGKMICFHRRYDLGDKHTMSQDDLKAMVESDDYISLPLYLYDHSGITMRTSAFSCPWDSGMVGYIVASKKEIRENFMVKRITKKVLEQAYKLLQSEVSTYDDYLTGNCHGFVIKDGNGEEIESCWGFLGDSDYCMAEAKSIVDHLAKSDLEVVTGQEFDNHFGVTL